MKLFKNLLSHKLLKIILFTLFVGSLIFLLILVLNPYLMNMDYIWNYGFASKIYHGLIPYRDFDLLQTPLSFYLSAVCLHLFGDYYIVYAIQGAFLITLMYYLFYRIIYLTFDDQNVALYCLIITPCYLFMTIITYNYNTLSLILLFSLILIELSNRQKFKNNVIIGFLLAALVLTKQSTAATVTLFMCANILLSNAPRLLKFKIIITRGITSFLFISFYLLYLYYHGALYDFIDHTILGTQDFAEDNLSEGSIFLFYYLITYFIILFSFIKFFKKNDLNLNNKFNMLLFYAIGYGFIIYPMFADAHFAFASLPFFLLLPFVYSREKLRVSKFITSVFFILIFTFLFKSVVKDYDLSFITENNRYRFAFIDKNTVDFIDTAENYILQKQKEGKVTVIIDSSASAFSLLQGDFHNPFDLLIRGNVGLNGEANKLKELEKLDNGTLILVGLDEYIHQNSMMKLRHHIMYNYRFVEHIDFFDVYEKTDVN